MRIFLAALFGGIAMFIWSAIAHMALPLGEAGLQELPDATLDLLAGQMGQQSGLYIFPGFGLPPDASQAAKREAMKHADERVARFPSGIMMYFPPGARPLTMGRYLGVEFATEFLESLLVVLLLVCTRLVTFGARLGFVTVAGVLAAIATNISYWNWYGFPAIYTAAYIFMQVVGFFLAGIAIALVLKKRQTAR